MAKIAVYRYELYDAQNDRWTRQPDCATKAYIEAAGGAMHFHTKTLVEESELTPEGLYILARRN